MSTKVVNIRELPGRTVPNDDKHIYIGRAGRGYDGYFGNPIAVGKPCQECGRVHGRGETLPCYEKYLKRRLRTDPEFRERVRALRNKTLVCFCKPRACHGDVLSRVADEPSPSDSLGDNKESPVGSMGDKEAHMNPQTETSKDPTDPFELLEVSLEELKNRAKELGVEIAEKDKAEIIEAVIEKTASMNTTSASAQEIQPGVLFALHSRDEEAKELIQQARSRIVANELANRRFQLLLRNKEGEMYTRTVPGVRVSEKRLPAVLRLLVLPPGGAQNEELNNFRENPDQYEQPVLVRVRRRNKDGSTGNYVMLYVRKKSMNTAEAVF